MPDSGICPALLRALACATLVLGTTGALAQQTMPADAWQWRGTAYGWLPSINGSTTFKQLTPGGGSIDIDVNPDKLLSHLKFAFAGTLEARKAPWSIAGDIMYVNLGGRASKIKSIDGPGGRIDIPLEATANTGVEQFMGEIAAGYALLQQPGVQSDLIVGVRYARLKNSLNWDFSTPAGPLPRSGSSEVTKNLTDGVVGLRGQVTLSGPWFVPYYADLGAGSSRFTWQAFAGVGYRYGNADFVAGWRHLAYNFHDDREISNIYLTGPIIGFGYKF